MAYTTVGSYFLQAFQIIAKFSFEIIGQYLISPIRSKFFKFQHIAYTAVSTNLT